MTRSKKNWIILLLIVILGGGTLAATWLNGDSTAIEIIYAPVETGPIKMTIETSGTVEPLSTVQVGCEVTGKIIEMAVDHDQEVTKGQVICRIDPELMEAENRQTEADLSKATSAVEDAKLFLEEQTVNLPIMTKQALAQKEEAEAALVSAEYNWKRIDQLYKENQASEAEWVNTKSAWLRARAAQITAESNYERAKSNEPLLLKRADQAKKQAEAVLDTAQARKAFTQTRVDRCTITSPIDGIVLKRYFDPGTTVTAAFQTPILFLLAPKLDQMRVNARVSESDINHIRIGQPARFTLEGIQRTSFEGELEERRNQPDMIANVVTYTVSFKVKNDERRTLLPGLSVNVEIECASKKNALFVSNAALRFKPPITLEERQALVNAVTWPPQPNLDQDGNSASYCSKAHVWQFDEKSRRWLVVPLWIGITDNINTEILGGASAGDRFVKRFVDKSGSGFSLKEAIRLARPDQRTL